MFYIFQCGKCGRGISRICEILMALGGEPKKQKEYLIYVKTAQGVRVFLCFRMQEERWRRAFHTVFPEFKGMDGRAEGAHLVL